MRREQMGREKKGVNEKKKKLEKNERSEKENMR